MFRFFWYVLLDSKMITILQAPWNYFLQKLNTVLKHKRWQLLVPCHHLNSYMASFLFCNHVKYHKLVIKSYVSFLNLKVTKCLRVLHSYYLLWLALLPLVLCFRCGQHIYICVGVLNLTAAIALCTLNM